MVELEDLRSFVEIVESGGFNRAARRLGVSKSIVSRRIARIEAELGARLLSRTTRGVSPTEAGAEFKSRADRILAELEEARDAVARQGGGVAGRLRLTAPMSFGVRHVAPTLAELARRHPRLEFDVSYTDRVVDVIGERFDAAIRIAAALGDAGLVARKIGPVRAVLAASPEYLARSGRPAAPGDLARHECLIYTGQASPDLVFRAGKRVFSVRPEGRLRSDSGEAIVQWAIEGLGIAAVPTFLLADAIESGKLEPVLTDYALPESAVYVLRAPGRLVPAKVRVLIDAMVESFGDRPVWDRCWMNGARPNRETPSRSA